MCARSGSPSSLTWAKSGFEDHLEDLRRALRSGDDIWLTEKFDGSLVVRSVIDGVVVWRTRGHWQLNQFETPVMAQVQRYPRLLDPSFALAASLLFEFTSAAPELRVVLAHAEDGLTLLGEVDHRQLLLVGTHAAGDPGRTVRRAPGGFGDFEREFARLEA